MWSSVDDESAGVQNTVKDVGCISSGLASGVHVAYWLLLGRGFCISETKKKTWCGY